MYTHHITLQYVTDIKKPRNAHLVQRFSGRKNKKGDSKMSRLNGYGGGAGNRLSNFP